MKQVFKTATSTSPEMQAMIAEIARLKAENEKLKPKPRALSFKVSEKKALSVYGLGRFPVTLYKAQWLRLIGAANAIAQFIQDNDSELIDK